MTHMFDRWCIPSLPVVAKYVLLSQNILRLHCEKKEKYSSDKRNKMRHLFAWKLESGIQCGGAPLCQTSKVWRVHAQDLTQANFCIFLRTNIMPPRWRSPELITHFYLKMGKDLKNLSTQSLPLFWGWPQGVSHTRHSFHVNIASYTGITDVYSINSWITYLEIISWTTNNKNCGDAKVFI